MSNEECNAIFDAKQLSAVFDRLDTLRKEKGLSYAALAEITGYSESTVMRYFTDHTKNPAFTTVVSLALALGVSLDWVIGAQTDAPASPENPYLDVIGAYQEGMSRMEECITSLSKTSRHSLTVSRIALAILLLVLAAVIAWLIYDITHPDRGWIQYAAEWASGALSMHF